MVAFLNYVYEVVLLTTLPRGYGKFMDMVVDPDNEVLYCAHLDGKHSVSNTKSKGWKGGALRPIEKGEGGCGEESKGGRGGDERRGSNGAEKNKSGEESSGDVINGDEERTSIMVRRGGVAVAVREQGRRQ
ncbi:hypothetical protein Scep_027739 [Stephania cephalantha]|uniref:WDR11 first beta-propeller domain-containing protein n=1 Tax=Stephania cephalantha TaxID=152367 RepID=A0AAP0EBW5_9MAGN